MARQPNPSLEQLRAAFGADQPIKEMDVPRVVDLADTLASRKVARDKAIFDLQQEIQAAKLAAEQRKKVGQLAEQQDPNRALSTAVPATFANVKGGEQSRMANIQRLETELAPESTIKTRAETMKGQAEGQRETDLQKLRGKQRLDEITLEAMLRDPKKDRSTNSFLLKAGSQSAGTDAFIKDIKDKVSKMSQKKGVKGGVSALQAKVQEKAKGFLGGDAEIQAFEEARPSFGRRLYKQLSNDVGNISESEGKFATDLVPSRYETPERRTAKVARLEELTQASKQAVADIVARVQSGEIEAKDAQEMVKSTVLGLMQEAAAKPLPGASAAPAGGGLDPAKAARLAELRAKKAAGTLK